MVPTHPLPRSCQQPSFELFSFLPSHLPQCSLATPFALCHFVLTEPLESGDLDAKPGSAMVSRQTLVHEVTGTLPGTVYAILAFLLLATCSPLGLFPKS